MTPREPDRFDKQARELVAKWYGPPLSRESVPWIAAALRAAESSALERAAQIADRYESGVAILIADSIRALKEPAAAPVACQRCDPEKPGMMWSTGLERHVLCTDSSHTAPAAETGKAPMLCNAVLIAVNPVCSRPMDHHGEHRWGIGNNSRAHAIADGRKPVVATPPTSQGPWRVGTKYGIHVYEGDRPVATFFRAEDASRAVNAQARIAELETALLDFLCSHGPPPDCAGKGECVCDAAWPLFDLPHGAVDSARRLRNRREAAQTGGPTK